MKKKRIILGVIAIILAIAMTSVVVYYWHSMGCDYKSLAAAILVNVGYVACIWFVIDVKIQELSK